MTGRLQIIRPAFILARSRSSGRSEEPSRSDGWQKVVKAKEGEVEIYINPGNHISSRTEYLPVLAQRLRECLNKAQVAQEAEVY